MKTLLLYLLFTYLALSVQAIFFEGIKPDFVLVLICFYSLKYGQTRGMTYGALSGLLIDTASGIILGPHIISNAIAGFLIGTLKEQLFQWNVFINSLVIAIFSVINIILIYLILETFSEVSFVNRSLEISIMEIIYTIIASLILYPFFKPYKDGIGASSL